LDRATAKKEKKKPDYYYYLFTAIGFAPGGSGPYTTQLQQKTYNKNKYIP
jgi:hypothetical protein